MYPHSLRKHLFSLDDTVDMIFYHVNCIGQAEYLLESLKPNFPKHDPCLKDACIFVEKLKWPTSNVKKHRPLPYLTDHYKRIFGPKRIDCSIKMEMRYSSIVFEHILFYWQDFTKVHRIKVFPKFPPGGPDNAYIYIF